MKNHNILVIEDEVIISSYIASSINRDYKIYQAYTSKKALQLIKEITFAIIIIDIKLKGNQDGFDIASEIKKIRRNKDTYLIFVSALMNNNKNILQCFDYGIVDFISKPFMPELLSKKVDVFIKMHEKEKKYKSQSYIINKQKKELIKIASNDALTQIYNRRRFDEMIEFEYNIVHRYSRPLTLIMLDIDFFKKINDEFGHVEGDKVLKELAQFMFHHKRNADRIFRYGGEEFTILCPETPVGNEHAMVIAERLRKLVEEHKFCNKYDLTISLGATEFRKDKDNIESFVKRADKALYKAKKNGRNRTEIIL